MKDNPFVLVAAIAFLVLVLICALKESKRTTLYKAFNVYGRLKAYIFVDFLGAGIAMLVMGIIGSKLDLPRWLAIILGVVLIAIAVLIYILTAKKCPDGLKKGLLISMLITGFGVAVKIAIFFIAAVWVLSTFETISGEDEFGGKTSYISMNGKVYNTDGRVVKGTLFTASDGNQYFKEQS